MNVSRPHDWTHANKKQLSNQVITRRHRKSHRARQATAPRPKYEPVALSAVLASFCYLSHSAPSISVASTAVWAPDSVRWAHNQQVYARRVGIGCSASVATRLGKPCEMPLQMALWFFEEFSMSISILLHLLETFGAQFAGSNFAGSNVIDGSLRPHCYAITFDCNAYQHQGSFIVYHMSTEMLICM